ncbi:RHS repeat-associated core domain-containing protein [Paraburkholderia sp. UCT2]|uniref:RHS repeat-associated core domain-containing protein n=1 Tax=Paraburkholderia sp. UCT2 TaxID=2615208 RepID=UPI0016560925|nr:RHS repeat-associated core domain-containing protein [Paraburkholderia sp. UCT2]
MYEAARLHDPIAHSSALAGFLVGALIGIAIIAAVAFATSTCGFGAALVAGLVAGFAAQGVLALGEAIGRSIKSTAGKISSGSPSVFINGEAAARVEFSAVACEKHAPIKRIAEGSSNVFINGKAAARKDDRTECDATIGDGSGNVFIGGGRVAYLKIDPEIPDWLRTTVQVAFIVAGLAGGLAGGLKAAAEEAGEAGESFGGRCATKYAAGFLEDAAISEAIGGLIGSPVEVTSGRKVLLPEADFVLPARMPVSCSRFYSSTLHEPGLLGPGWRLDWEITLRRTDDALIYIGPQGRPIHFPLLKPGHELYDAAELIWLSRLDDGRYLVRTPERYYFLFGDFDDSGLARLVMIEGPDAQQMTLTWDTAGRPVEVQADGGYRLRLQYQEAPARLSRIELLEGGTLGTLVSYGYDSAGYLASVTDRAGVVTRRFGYSDGLMTHHANAEGFLCRYRWEILAGQPRVIEHDNSSGERYGFHYDFAAGHAEVTDTFGNVARWDFDAKEQITAHTGFDGAQYGAEYNASGWPIVLHLPGGRTRRIDYDELGRPVAHTDPLGQITRTDYHASTSLPRQTTLHDGRRWMTVYNGQHQAIETVDPLGRRTVMHYGEDGQLQRVTDAKGGIVTLEHDARGLLNARTDCSGKTTHYTYDRDGLLDTVTDALGQTTRIRYGAQGLPEAVTRPDRQTERYQWNALGYLVRHTNAAHHTQQWERDGVGRVLRHTDAEGRTVHFERDAHGRPVKLTNGNGASYQFGWDAADRLLREQRVDGSVHEFRYDAAGFLQYIASQAGSSRRMEVHERDALGRLVRRSGDHSDTAYRYNVLGQLTEARRTPTVAGKDLGIVADTVRMEYDAAGQLLAEWSAHGRVAYERDELGNPLALTLPQGQRIETLYYGSGHVHQMRFEGAIIADFERDDLHREILRTQGRLSTHTGYTSLGQIAWQRAHAPKAEASDVPDETHSVLWRRYRYDRSGELTESYDSFQGHTLYDYDRTGQLLRRSAESFDVERFTWDAAGNLLDDAGREPNVKLSPLLDNLLRRYRGVSYTYDDWEQLVSRNGMGLRWDAEGHLLSVDDGVQHTAYRYDALGRRIGKSTRATRHPGMPRDTKPPEEIRFVWQGLRLLQEQDGKGQSRTYLYDPVRGYAPVARIDHAGRSDHSEVYHYHTDPTGTPREVTDADGRPVWSGNYSAWGQVRANMQTAVFNQPLRMPGQYHDEESGLSYNTFRYYDPHCGRFISPDPIGLAGGLNLYQYAANPISWIDPWGLSDLPLGSEENPFSTSNAARLDAMRQAGIPTSQQPVSQSMNSSGMEYRYLVPQEGGGTVEATVQQQTMDSSHVDSPHWEAGKVKVDPITGETRINDYGRPKIANPKGKAYYTSEGC